VGGVHGALPFVRAMFWWIFWAEFTSVYEGLYLGILILLDKVTIRYWI
jgi:hypothetical protein